LNESDLLRRMVFKSSPTCLCKENGQKVHISRLGNKYLFETISTLVQAYERYGSHPSGYMGCMSRAARELYYNMLREMKKRRLCFACGKKVKEGMLPFEMRCFKCVVEGTESIISYSDYKKTLNENPGEFTVI